MEEHPECLSSDALSQYTGELAEIEVTLERVLDGHPLIYHGARPALRNVPNAYNVRPDPPE